MELRMIETFLQVAATQNFSRAAEELGYSQSAVTVQMQKLEKELDTQLFERLGKRVYLTEKGEEFVFYAGEIVKATQAALEFAQQDTAVRGKLRIGGVESICTSLFPKLLMELHRRCPQVELVIRSGTTDDMLALAARNELDLVLTLDEPLCKSDFDCLLKQDEEIVFVTRYDGRGSRSVPLAELCRKAFILTETGAAYRYQLEQLLADRGLEIRPKVEIGNTETIINLLKKGMGVSFLPRFTVEDALLERNLVQLTTDLPPVFMYHQLLCHRSKWVTRQMQIFTDLTREYFSAQRP